LIGKTLTASGAVVFRATDTSDVQQFDRFAGRTQAVIIQGEPVESLRRTDFERQQIAEMRVFAAHVFRSGVDTVILLPPLPRALAAPAMQAIAKVCRGERPPRLYAWLRVISGIRGSVLGWKPPQNSEATQVSHDARETTSGHVPRLDEHAYPRPFGSWVWISPYGRDEYPGTKRRIGTWLKISSRKCGIR
jgi:hypothetical protein